MATHEQETTAYEILGVHPSAPTELISACYWLATRELQERRAADPEADAALHRLTHAYESVADPVRRGGYNLSIGYIDEPLMKRALPRRRFFLLRVFRRSHELGWSVDPREVLGLHPSAPPASVPIAHRIMRDTYLRLPAGSRRRETLLSLLDESYAVLKNVGLAEHESPAPARDGPPISDPPGPSWPPKTSLSASGEPAEAGAKRAGRGGAHRIALAVVASAGIVARGVRQVVVTIAAMSVVVVGCVATAVHWSVLALAALTVAAVRFVAPYVRSAWLATRRWLDPSWEEQRKTAVDRSGDANGPLVTPDEVFLGRLASTVGRSKSGHHRPSDETTRR